MADLLNSIGTAPMNMRAFVNHVGNKRYYSSTDAVVSFNGVKLEEVCSIMWTINEPKQPLYGYNSWTFDEVAVGARIIMGSFVINFIIPNYLELVLKGASGASDEDIVYKNTGSKSLQDRHTSLFPKGFTIDVAYGKENDAITGARPHLFLDKVHVQSSQIIHDPNGQPIMEEYSFIARDRDFGR